MAFIDSELAKRRQAQSASSTSHIQGLAELSENGALIDAGLHRQPAALGKLHEIDLGPDATLKNIERTEEAKRRLEGGALEDEGDGKVKLRRDGKPFRRRRRNSQDVKRDKLVEEVMRESKRECSFPPRTAGSGLTPVQWKSTTNLRSIYSMMIRQLMIVLPSNLEESSWTQYPRAGSGQLRLLRRTRRELRSMISQEARSSVGVGAHVLRCGSSRRRRPRSRFLFGYCRINSIAMKNFHRELVQSGNLEEITSESWKKRYAMFRISYSSNRYFVTHIIFYSILNLSPRSFRHLFTC